jgi:hypothetical protein
MDVLSGPFWRQDVPIGDEALLALVIRHRPKNEESRSDRQGRWRVLIARRTVDPPTAITFLHSPSKDLFGFAGQICRSSAAQLLRGA